MVVVCDRRNHCSEAAHCGGAKPHESCSECDKCPVNKEARCISIRSDEPDDNDLKSKWAGKDLSGANKPLF